MTSPKQIEANKKNAKQSTGPKTEKGKQVSSMNALTHGLTAEQIVIEGEDPADFEWVMQGLIKEYAPRTILEQQLIERLAGYLWRLKRIPALEAAILEAHRLVVQREIKAEKENPSIHDFSWKESRKRLLKDIKKWSAEDVQKGGSLEDSSEIEMSQEQAELLEEEKRERAKQAVLEFGRALLRDASQHDAIGKLARYEAHLANAVERTIRQLDKLREKRSSETKGSAQIVDLESVKDGG